MYVAESVPSELDVETSHQLPKSRLNIECSEALHAVFRPLSYKELDCLLEEVNV